MIPSGDIGILTTDRDLVVQSWDDWLAAVTSITAETASGRPLGEFAPHVEERRFLARIEETLTSGAVQVLSPAFHPSLLPCPPRTPSLHFTEMQQRITIGPLLEGGRISGLLITIQDVTAQLEAERELAAGLASGDPDIRRAAADSIAAAQRLEAFAPFSPALGSDDWRVRGDAVRGLAAAADHDLLRALLATLQREHRHFGTLSSALKLLAVTDVDVTGPLAELLQDPDADLRIQAALALGEQHQPAAAPPLLRALEDPDPNVRFHAIEALGRLRAESAIEPLLAIVESRDFFFTFAALEALGLIQDSRVAPRLVALLEDEDLREGVTHALSQIGDEHVVAPLVTALNRTQNAGAAVARALAAITDRLVAEGHDDLDVAATVRDTLSSTGRTHLLAAAASAPADAQPAIAKVLAWTPGDDAVQALRRLAEMPVARAAAVEALVRHGEAAVDPFVEMLGSDDAELRATAIGALGRLGSQRATGPLVERLQHDAQTAIAACGALARIADVEAFEPLLDTGRPHRPCRPAGGDRRAQFDRSPRDARACDQSADGRTTRWCANPPFALQATSDIRRHCRWLSPRQQTRSKRFVSRHSSTSPFSRAIKCSGSLAPHCAPRRRAPGRPARARWRESKPRRRSSLLSGALQDEDQWVRYYAARALAEHRSGPAVPRLVELAESDPSVPVRIAALDALGARRTAEATSILVRAAHDPKSDVAAAALRALGRLRGHDALETLRSIGRAGDVASRRAAVEGLGAHATTEAVAQLEWIAAADAEPAVAELAVQQLAEIASSRDGGAQAAIDALLALCAVPERRDAAAARLSSLPVAAAHDVARGLAHADPAVRKRTVEVLSRFRHADATRHLEAAFADADAAVRETAVVAIMRLGSAGYDDTLRRLAEHDPSKPVRRAAAAALASRRSAH